ncbi:UNVERIFIED_CONTAM: hypothetical protein FKN15_003724 [Acipenser sinensis]
MEKSLVVILLLAGLCDDASCHSRTYIPVGEIKTWTDARSYCREKHTDLVTVHSLEEQQQILNVAKDYQFWIGLYRDSENWQWSTGDAVSYTKWVAESSPAAKATATTKPLTGTQTSPKPGKRRQVVRIEIKAPEGLDPEDPKITDAILAQNQVPQPKLQVLQNHRLEPRPLLNQLQERLSKGMTLRWRKKDRKIFHKLEEEEGGV